MAKNVNVYRLNSKALLRGTKSLTSKDGFSVLKISKVQALTMDSGKFFSADYETAKIEAGLDRCETLKENETYNGYIAVWKGRRFQAYRMNGSLSLSPEYTMAGDNKLSIDGEVKQVSFICGYLNDSFLQYANIGERLEDAIRNNDGKIVLTDREKEELLNFVASYTDSNHLLIAI